MYRSGETSCSISAIGNSGVSASGPTGSRVPGCSGGGGGAGRSGMTLYHCRGRSDSCRTYLTWLSMDASGGQAKMVINATLVHLPAPGYIRLLAEVASGSPAPADWLARAGLAAALARTDGRCIWHRLNALCQTHTSAGLG